MVKEYYKKTMHHWRVLLRDKAYLWSLVIGVVVIVGALFVNHFVSAFHDEVLYAPVGDLILDKIPTLNLEILFTWGFYILVALVFLYPILFKPELLPFALKTAGILLLTRSMFISLTYVGPPAGFFYESDFAALNLAGEAPYVFRNDLFFSGHTAMPFLGFLLFYKTKIIKWVMLFGSFVMAATVLFMHVHYSIDVFAAFFIAYGVYAFSDKVFNHLNLRFYKKIKLHGWSAFQKRLLKLAKKRDQRAFYKVKKSASLYGNLKVKKKITH